MGVHQGLPCAIFTTGEGDVSFCLSRAQNPCKLQVSENGPVNLSTVQKMLVVLLLKGWLAHSFSRLLERPTWSLLHWHRMRVCKAVALAITACPRIRPRHQSDADWQGDRSQAAFQAPMSSRIIPVATCSSIEMDMGAPSSLLAPMTEPHVFGFGFISRSNNGYISCVLPTGRARVACAARNNNKHLSI